MSSTDWKKPAIASRPLYSVGSPNFARYGSSKAPSSANISAAVFGFLSEKAVYSSISSLAFFIDILLFLTISESAFHSGPHGSVKQIHHEELDNSDKERPNAFPEIVLKQTDSGIQQLHGACERTQELQRRCGLLVDCPQCEQSQRDCARPRVHRQYQRRLRWNGSRREQISRTDDPHDGKAARYQNIDSCDHRSQPHRLCSRH